MNKIIELVGAPAVGKSSLLDCLSKTRSDIRFLSFSQLIYDFLKTKSDNSENYSARLEEAIHFGMDYVIQKQPVVLATHTVYKNSNGSFEFRVESEMFLKPCAYIHLIAKPEEIFRRISLDNELKRRTRRYNLEEIKMIQSFSRIITEKIAKFSGSDYWEIDNSTPDNEKVVARLNELIRNYIK
jgi:adenylate kinase